MITIIKRELKNYFKNPIFYVGIVCIFVFIYSSLSPYLALRYFDENATLKEVKNSDKDIMDGYMRSTTDEQIQLGLEQIKEDLIVLYELSEKEAVAIINDVKENCDDIQEYNALFSKKYDFGSNYYFAKNKNRLGTVAELNAHLEEKMKDHTYSWYFSKKYADFAGLFVVFFASILLAFLFIRDMKKDTYELLHTKPISASSYMLGKILGGFLAICIVVIIITSIFTVLCMYNGKQAGFPISIFDLWIADFLYIIPNLMMITCIYAVVALLFKNPLPAAPMIFLYIIYSNMGSVGKDGMYGYYGRPLSIMVRFPGNFLDTSPPPMVLANQISLILFSVILTLISIYIWKRRRV